MYRAIPVGCLPARTQADIDGAVREMVTPWPTTAVGTLFHVFHMPTILLPRLPVRARSFPWQAGRVTPREEPEVRCGGPSSAVHSVKAARRGAGKVKWRRASAPTQQWPLRRTGGVCRQLTGDTIPVPGCSVGQPFTMHSGESVVKSVYVSVDQILIISMRACDVVRQLCGAGTSAQLKTLGSGEMSGRVTLIADVVVLLRGQLN